MPDQIDRTMALRRELVDAVESAPIRVTDRPRPRMIVAGLAVFALAGALTGGAISAAALAGSGDDGPVDIDIASMTSQVTYGDTVLYGSPIVISSKGLTNVDLGARPVEATMVVFAMRCDETGSTADISLDGEWLQGGDCGGGQLPPTGTGPHTLTIATHGRFLLWASWASEPPTPGPSAAQQSEIDDGLATWEEYQAAFARYAACSEAAGYPLEGYQTLENTQRIVYGPSNAGVESGSDRICYAAEFQEVDVLWQLAHEDTSQTAQFLRDCLQDHGIDPPETMQEILVAVHDAGLSTEDCAS
ncbi:MAG TPA: hypothetical protein VGO65_02345 [Pseudolysinimonas sp.]|jgi:hypothetical protein|nr:hypothetical protein [Pseudolysinimonas sp.]